MSKTRGDVGAKIRDRSGNNIKTKCDSAPAAGSKSGVHLVVDELCHSPNMTRRSACNDPEPSAVEGDSHKKTRSKKNQRLSRRSEPYIKRKTTKSDDDSIVKKSSSPSKRHRNVALEFVAGPAPEDEVDRSSPSFPTSAALVSSSGSSLMNSSKRHRSSSAPVSAVVMKEEVLLDVDDRLESLLEEYSEHLTEMFFLQNHGMMMDYFAWKKKKTPQLSFFLKTQQLDYSEEFVDFKPSPPKIRASTRRSISALPASAFLQENRKHPTRRSLNSTTNSTPRTSASSVLDETKSSNSIPSYSRKSPSRSAPPISVSENGVSNRRGRKSHPTPQVILSNDENPDEETVDEDEERKSRKSEKIEGKLPKGAKEKDEKKEKGVAFEEMDIQQRAKHEANVLLRIEELRRGGMWSARKMPKASEPSRGKAHRDYMLEEMQWLANDFKQEAKWKRASAKKLARAVEKYHQEQASREERALKEETNRLRKIASTLAKDVKQFWSNIEKVVEFKQKSRLEQKRQKALDLHLNFIVDQTEKYSNWLTEGLTSSAPASTNVSSRANSPDVEFNPSELDDDDDETTLLKAEREDGIALDDEDDDKLKLDPSTKDWKKCVEEELSALKAEGEKPIEELLRELPPEMWEASTSLPTDEESEGVADASSSDDDFDASDADSDDVEDTINEQERHEKENDKEKSAKELKELDDEADMPLEDLIKLYGGAFTDEALEDKSFNEKTEDEVTDKNASKLKNISEVSEKSSQKEVAEALDEDDEDESDEGGKMSPSFDEDGLNSLLGDLEEVGVGEEKSLGGGSRFDTASRNSVSDRKEADAHDGLEDATAAAMAIQPKGFTFESARVQIQVPFLLRGRLREYQHIGLEWLGTLYEKKLNGILADEMGLGKTIQTIALLAHLSCEKGIWGPHLIVVPTSVMLNWEMEFKRWCPGLKILTYFGTPKERKMKRTGWTKVNAFHVCITSYKLVIQDHSVFRRKKWKYLVLDEAQNIKNFKSQRWQCLLNFVSQRRLLLTGTPLQNSLMELWSLMHFLMPHIFASHREFKEWFANPLSGMIEGSQEYNENLVARLHKVLRPFLLRRLKVDVEKQMPKKFEHVVMCRLSKRQRFLYDDFMSQASTRETLAGGTFMSVINVLMQLRKVCNHPDLFEGRPIVSPFRTEGVTFRTASLAYNIIKGPFDRADDLLFPNFCVLEVESVSGWESSRSQTLRTPEIWIEEVDIRPDPPHRFKLDQPLFPKYDGSFPPYMVQLKEQERREEQQRQEELHRQEQRRLEEQRLRDQRQSVIRQPVVSVSVSSGVNVPQVPAVVQSISAQMRPLTSAQTISTASGSFLRLTPISSPLTPCALVPVSHPAIATPPPRFPGPVPLRPMTTTDLSDLEPQTSTPRSGSATSVSSTPMVPTPLSSTPNLLKNLQITFSPQQGARLTLPAGVTQLSQYIQIIQGPDGKPVIRAASQPPVLTTQQPLRPLGTSSLEKSLQTVSSLGSQLTTQQGTVIAQNLQRTTPIVATTPLLTTVAPSAPIANVKPVQKVDPIITTVSSVETVSSASTTATSTVPTTANSDAQSGIPNSTSSSFPDSTPANFNLASSSEHIPETSSLSKISPAVSLSTSTIHKPRAEIVPSLTRTTEPPAEDPLPRDLRLPGKRGGRLHLAEILDRRDEWRRGKLERLVHENKRRGEVKPIYGADVIKAVTLPLKPCGGRGFNKGQGSIYCRATKLETRPNRKHAFWKRTDALCNAIKDPVTRLEELDEVMQRFLMYVHPVLSPPIDLHVSHPDPSVFLGVEDMLSRLTLFVQRRSSVRLHFMQRQALVQFPETRLIQYDCGKLQVLASLLHDLKSGGHRVLIFTQMSKMLNILEAFLNYHGHTYLRLDGSTKIEQRQILMERFNGDRRIFCFILSTRSGGIGVNLTGADTVIFYDSDWNPTMDAQAQDRCHRIGQTRDVHIYRLISEQTIEENILKKAHQKKLLADMTIEGGNFTTTFFKQSNLKDLFEEPSGLKELEDGHGERPEPIKHTIGTRRSVREAKKEEGETKEKEEEKEESEEEGKKKEELTADDIKKAFDEAEDEEDVEAGKVTDQEQKEELAEFDESVPLTTEDDEGNLSTIMEATSNDADPLAQVEEALARLTQELSPIEQYAVKFVEKLRETLNLEALEAADEDISIAKEEWELTHMQALKEEEEIRAEVEEDEMYYTTEARCRGGASGSSSATKRVGVPADVFGSNGDSTRGMHAGPMRSCRHDAAAAARRVELEGGLLEDQLRKSWGRMETMKQRQQRQRRPEEDEDEEVDEDDEETEATEEDEETDEYYEDSASPEKKKKRAKGQGLAGRGRKRKSEIGSTSTLCKKAFGADEDDDEATTPKRFRAWDDEGSDSPSDDKKRKKKKSTRKRRKEPRGSRNRLRDDEDDYDDFVRSRSVSSKSDSDDIESLDGGDRRTVRGALIVNADEAVITGSRGRASSGGGMAATRSGRIVCPPVRMTSPDEFVTSVQEQRRILNQLQRQNQQQKSPLPTVGGRAYVAATSVPSTSSATSVINSASPMKPPSSLGTATTAPRLAGVFTQNVSQSVIVSSSASGLSSHNLIVKASASTTPSSQPAEVNFSASKTSPHLRPQILTTPSGQQIQIATSPSTPSQQLQFLPRGVLQLNPSQLRLPGAGSLIVQRLPTPSQQQPHQVTLNLASLPQTNFTSSTTSTTTTAQTKSPGEIVIEILKVCDQGTGGGSVTGGISGGTGTLRTINHPLQLQHVQQLQPQGNAIQHPQQQFQPVTQRRVVLSPGTLLAARSGIGNIVRPATQSSALGGVIVNRPSNVSGANVAAAPITILRPSRPSSAVGASTAAVQLIKQQEQIIRLQQQPLQFTPQHRPQQILIQQRTAGGTLQPQLIRLQSVPSGATSTNQSQLKIQQLLQLRQQQQQQLLKKKYISSCESIPISATVLPSSSAGPHTGGVAGVAQQITITPISGASTNVRAPSDVASSNATPTAAQSQGPNNVWDFINSGQTTEKK